MAIVSTHRALLLASLILGLSVYQKSFALVSREQNNADNELPSSSHVNRAPSVSGLSDAVSLSTDEQLPQTNISATTASGKICGIPASKSLQFDHTLARNYVANAKTIVRLGNSGALGRFNNQILQILHALDFMYDRHGEVETVNNDNETTTATLVVSNWVVHFFQDLLGDDWLGIVQQTLPIKLGGESTRGQWKGYAEPYHFSSAKIYFYRMKVHFETPLDIIMQRRRLFFSTIFGRPEQCSLMQRLQKHLGSPDYVAIHIRTLEGGCTSVMPSHYERECFMSSDYIRSILKATNATALPIVVLSDMQNISLITNLQQAFGTQIVIPAWKFSDTNYTVVDDMMVAASSRVFVGTRVSSMAIIIAQLRVLLYRYDPSSNYVYVYPGNDTGDSMPIVCEECLFSCTMQQRADKLCGLNGIIA